MQPIGDVTLQREDEPGDDEAKSSQSRDLPMDPFPKADELEVGHGDFVLYHDLRDQFRA